LTEECTTTKIRAKIYPENADLQELTWRVTDDAGVDSTFAAIRWEKGNSEEAIIEVKGDGAFRVRCMCKNGKQQGYGLISVLEYKAEGLGVRNLNPYEFLSASLFSATGGLIGNGNERGISTQRDGISWVAYENLDFGEFGSDEVEIPVFSFGGDTPFTFWEGIPHAEGSRIIGTKDYTLPSVWNTYIPDTFKLNKRLKGITTFGVELDRKIHMKGFQFVKQEKAFAKLYAGEADVIYGDSFKRQGNAVCGIGNNVTLVFDGMDFGETLVSSLVIRGRALHEVNNIRLLTEWEDGRTEQESLEFFHTEEMTEAEFNIAPRHGKVKVSFVFLPGSAFDFEWFMFLNKTI
jgi:beta-galactosidase